MSNVYAKILALHQQRTNEQGATDEKLHVAPSLAYVIYKKKKIDWIKREGLDAPCFYSCLARITISPSTVSIEILNFPAHMSSLPPDPQWAIVASPSLS